MRRDRFGQSGLAAHILIPVTLTAADPLGGIQFDLDYDNSIMSVVATLGDASRSEGKSLFYADITPQKRRFLIVGLNQNSVPSGTLLNVFINLTVNAPTGAYAWTLSNIVGSDPAGVIEQVTGTNAAVTVSGDQNVRLLAGGVLNGRNPHERMN